MGWGSEMEKGVYKVREVGERGRGSDRDREKEMR